MMRFGPIPYDRLDDDQQRMSTLAQHSGPYQAFLRAPRLWEALQKVRSYLSGGSLLDATAREAIMLAIAQHWRSTAAFAAHVPLARRAGVSDEAIAAIGQGHMPKDLPDTAALALECTFALLHDHSVGDALYARAIALLGERFLVEIIGLIGFFSTTALTLNLAGIGGNAPFTGAQEQYSPAD